jgi:hypothetical protein
MDWEKVPTYAGADHFCAPKFLLMMMQIGKWQICSKIVDDDATFFISHSP